MGIFYAIGSAMGTAASLYGERQNRANQKEFARKGIQWKVRDAKKAGIHPLAALGAQTHSFQPVSVGGSASGFDAMGQNIDRAIAATSDGRGRKDQYNREVQKLTLQNFRLRNDMLSSQIARVRQAGTPPGEPGINNPAVQTIPVRREATVQEGSQAAGNVGDVHLTKTPRGYAVVPSKDAKERLEDFTIPQLQWSARNIVGPLLDSKRMPKLPKPRKGYIWKYNPSYGEWTEIRKPAYNLYDYFRR